LSDIPANRGWIDDGDSGVLVEPAEQSIADGILRATRLDRAAAAASNRATVRARADRTTRLRELETMLIEVVRSARGAST
jgi:hypothetical protein